MTTTAESPTVVELAPGAYPLVAPLFAGAWADRAYIDAVVEGRVPARVFVDRLDGPRAALVCRTYEFFVGGQPVHWMRRFIAEAPAEVGVFRFVYGYVSFDDAWVAALRQDAARQGAPALGAIARRTYRLDPAHHDVARAPAPLPAGVALRLLDADLARRADEELDEVIGLMWEGYEPFAAHGFGTVAVQEATGRPLSVCAAFGRSAAEANLGVGTHPDHRRRGLAAACSRAAIGQALDLGLVPTWDCDAANPPSAALAASLGFTELPGFVELAFPDRGKPIPTTGLWRPEPGPAGATLWRRAGMSIPSPRS